MGQRPKTKMPVSERAKQFAPFSALRGLEAALKRKENETMYESKKMLSDEALISLNKVLSRLEAGMTVKVRYYDENIKRYTDITGTVLSHDRTYGCIRIDTTAILYDELAGIAILKSAAPK